MSTAYIYTAADTQRRFVEDAKGSHYAGDVEPERGAFARDRARVQHSAAFRRLADKTQVVGPRDGDTPRNRLTHSTEVAQIARGIGKDLGLDEDLCELAGLTHDIGHSPYGHNGENALNELAQDCGGFEGNAQNLRILTKLEPKILDAYGQSVGLNLSRAALDASCKYPRTRTNADGSVNRKYSAYDSEAEVLAWVRQGHEDDLPPMEAQVMDWADDIAYSVHDVEDGIVSQRISLRVLWDLLEIARLAEKGAAAFGGDAEQMVEAAARLQGLEVVQKAAEFRRSLSGFVTLKRLTSELVGRYVSAAVVATRNSGEVLGRQHGRLIIPEQAEHEVKLLKTIAVMYVMDDPRHLALQDRQRERIARVHDYLIAGAPGSLDATFREWWLEASTEAERHRVIIDQIASMTESRLERIARFAASISGFPG